MQQLWQQLTFLLARELFNTNSTMEIPDDALESILNLAQKHAVEPLLLQQIKAISTAFGVHFQNLRSRTLAFILRNEQINRLQDEVLLLLEENGIPCAILKGNSVALCYPRPELRALGDIDILVSPDSYQTACALLSRSGFTSLNEHVFHMSFQKNRICVELHQAVSRFPDTSLAQATMHMMDSALISAVSGRIENHVFPVLRIEHQLIALLAHMERHMSSGGIGLRQLCDWAVTVHHYREEITEEVLAVLKECGLLQFAKILTKTCMMYLDLPHVQWADSASVKYATMMFTEIMTGSNISNVDNERILSVSIIRNSRESNQSLLIGSIAKLNQKARLDFPFIRWCPLVLPFFWLYYLIRRSIRIQQGEQAHASIRNALNHAGKYKKLLNKLKIYE